MLKLDRKIGDALTEFLVLSCLTILVPLFLALDLIVFENGVSELSVTEITQELLLLFCVSLFAFRAWRDPASRGFLSLVAGFFSCMLVRELDSFQDRLLFHGFWVWPCSLIAVCTIAYAIKHAGTVLGPMVDFIGTKSYSFILFGLVVVLVLSRTMGTGELFWKQVLRNSDYRSVKTALQEGLELFGYIFICYGAVLFPRFHSHNAK